MTSGNPPAVVLVSGGLDSATTLAIAHAEGFACHALTFDYAQRHRMELLAAQHVAESIGVIEHKFITIDLRALGGSALTADIDVPKDRAQAETEEIPITYVPARNMIFLSYALAYAETINATDIFIGVNAIDYSGYPDCRPAFIRAFEHAANLGTRSGAEGRPFSIHTPLIDLTKAQIIRTGVDLGVDYSLTLSCYDPKDLGDGRWNPCGRCDSCQLRAAGFYEAGLNDPAQ